MNRKKISKATREAVYAKYGGHCAYCGCEIDIKNMQVDHKIPVLHGEIGIAAESDIDTLENYMPACRSCNHYKSTLTVEKFRRQIENMCGVLMRDSVTYKNAVRFGQVIPNRHKPVFYFEKVGGENESEQL
ncbi:MAG: HNH endonuclease [Ruminococcus sp.]|nr:HNH endonuclease [Ruminococcus sp.]MCM1380591.1 HNH endonuclease [Muribaculaceae bacterium]MCM1479774.1 HNH endonuclease [Muribaculaceae bacterium]